MELKDNLCSHYFPVNPECNYVQSNTMKVKYSMQTQILVDINLL